MVSHRVFGFLEHRFGVLWEGFGWAKNVYILSSAASRVLWCASDGSTCLIATYQQGGSFANEKVFHSSGFLRGLLQPSVKTYRTRRVACLHTKRDHDADDRILSTHRIRRRRRDHQSVRSRLPPGQSDRMIESPDRSGVPLVIIYGHEARGFWSCEPLSKIDVSRYTGSL